MAMTREELMNNELSLAATSHSQHQQCKSVGMFWMALVLYSAAIVSGLQEVSAQSFPVQANIFLQPPYSPYLNDYVAPGSEKVRVNLFLKDLASPELQIKLRFRIEGVGITIQSRQNYNPPPIGLSGGIPLILTSDDLVEYFQPRNLDIAGISRAQFERGTRLPDGVYRFTVEVYDYNRNTLISNRGTTMAWIVLNDPPMLNLPRNGEKVQITDPQNIVFSWTPRHTGSPNSAFTTEYTFRIVELAPSPSERAGGEAYALQSQQPLVEITSTFPQIVYSMSEPALIPGRKYAWMVIARDVNGLDLFKNQGMSEAGIFQFGDALLTPENLHLQSAGPSRLTVRWDQSLAGWEPASYRVRYRPRHNRTIEEWYEATSLDQWRAITSLQPDTEYEVQVRAEQPAQKSEYTPITVFRTLVQDENEFVCKDNVSMPAIIPPDNTSPQFMLSINDTLHIADGHDIVVRQVRQGSIPNTYTGRGVAIVRFLNSIKLQVAFENITVNESFWVVNGMIETLSDLDGTIAAEEEPQVEEGTEISSSEENDSLIVVPPVVYEVKGEIDTVIVTDDGRVLVRDTQGNETEFEQPVDEVTGEKKQVVITDNLGNQITIDKDGHIQKVGSKPSNLASNGESVNPTSLNDFNRNVLEVLNKLKNEHSNNIDSLRKEASSVVKTIDELIEAGGFYPPRIKGAKDELITEGLSKYTTRVTRSDETKKQMEEVMLNLDDARNSLFDIDFLLQRRLEAIELIEDIINSSSLFDELTAFLENGNDTAAIEAQVVEFIDQQINEG